MSSCYISKKRLENYWRNYMSDKMWCNAYPERCPNYKCSLALVINEESTLVEAGIPVDKADFSKECKYYHTLPIKVIKEK